MVQENNKTQGVEIATDRFMHFNREGILLWDWSLFDEVDASSDSRAIALKKDWGHANGLALAPEGQVAVSFRTLDEVWLLNPIDKRVDWKLGQQGNIVPPPTAQFLKQHAPHFLPSGELMLFDNGEEGIRAQSRVLVLALQQHKKVATPTLAINIPQYLSSGKRGSVYPVNERQFMVCSTEHSAFFIINKNEAIAWRINSTMPAYRALPIKNLP